MLRAAVAAADERCRQVERNNQVLRDEYLALQTTNNALEEKFKKVRILPIHWFSNGRAQVSEENITVVERLMELKVREVELRNMEIERDQKAVDKRRQLELDEAARADVPVYEFGANIVELPSTSLGYAAAAIEDCLPTVCTHRFTAHSTDVTSLCWTHSGQRLATGGTDRRLLLWDFGTVHIKS